LELRELYLLGINFCIRHLNKGEKDFGKVGIDLYQIALQRKLLMNDGLLSRYTYRNIAMMAIRVEDFDWAASFSEEYKPYLDKKHQDSSYYFNLALIYYNRGQLDESLDAMIHVDFKDPLIHLAAKTLQLKLYYELGEWSLLDSHLDTMQMYLIRKKILGYHKQNYKNIIKYTRNIIGLAEFDTDKKIKLITQITDAKPLTERKWLLAQLG
jgi:tetratricopeptide (TPR) repeat protein